jgi:hypothetical protein
LKGERRTKISTAFNQKNQRKSALFRVKLCLKTFSDILLEQDVMEDFQMFKSTRLILFLVAILLTGCTISIPNMESITGSGNVVSQEANISGFDMVDISHAFEVNIDQSDAFSVIIRVDDNLVEHLNVVKQGNTLKIGFRPGTASIFRNATLEATITMPELTGLDLSGASQATISGFKSTKSLNTDLSGSSSLLGDIEAHDAMFDVSGSSNVTLTGSAGDVTVDARGASRVNLEDFSVSDASLKASGASQVTVNASGTLNADASGSSTVYYLGNPTLGKVDTSGASSIKRK